MQSITNSPFEADNGQPHECEHEQIEARIRTLSNGSQAPYWQCLRCGSGLRAVGRHDYAARQAALDAPPFDTDLRDRWDREQREAWRVWREQRTGSWWSEYDDYLNSAEWAERRRLRLEKDDGCCQARLVGCARAATQVHHLTYQHLGNEPLFDLISVCASCHDAITAMDRQRA